MRLIIDIPDILMEYIVKGKDLSEEQNDEMAHAIADGVPLPKGHGDLVDRNDLSLMTVHMIDGVFVCDAPTIIEADKSKSEE